MIIYEWNLNIGKTDTDQGSVLQTRSIVGLGRFKKSQSDGVISIKSKENNNKKIM